jgi:hypothetical protein
MRGGGGRTDPFDESHHLRRCFINDQRLIAALPVVQLYEPWIADVVPLPVFQFCLMLPSRDGNEALPADCVNRAVVIEPMDEFSGHRAFGEAQPRASVIL